MRVLVLCAGDGSRWADALGGPKHLAPLLGEPILHRTVRLIAELAPGADVRIVVADVKDDRYKVRGSRRARARLSPELGGVDKFASSRHLWDPSGRTVLLYGDVFFTRAALEAILSPEPFAEGWRAFCRFDASTVTGSRGGEVFAHVIDPEAHDRYSSAIDRCAELVQAGVISEAGGWEVYRVMCGVDGAAVRRHFPDGSPMNPRLGSATEILDATEDLDELADWESWCWHFARYSAGERVRLGMVR